jgi:hypothetical protein
LRPPAASNIARILQPPGARCHPRGTPGPIVVEQATTSRIVDFNVEQL